MSMQFYKPNSRNTGAALSVSFNSKGDKKGVFFELIKQVSWDDSTKKGKFGGGAKILSKFNTTEIAQFIDVIERGADFEKALYHTNGESSSQINFTKMRNKVQQGGKWVDAEGYKGYVLYVNKGEDKISIGLTFSEAVELREYLKFALNHIFTALYSESIKEAKEYRERKEAEEAAKSQKTVKTAAPKAKSVEDFVKPAVEEDESQDIPF